MKTINIYVDGSHPEVQMLPLFDAKEAVEQGIGVIHTMCTNFFAFHYLDKGYEVVMRSKHGVMVLSDILDNSAPYCNREIRRAHNVEKMFRANAFAWQEERLTSLARGKADFERVSSEFTLNPIFKPSYAAKTSAKYKFALSKLLEELYANVYLAEDSKTAHEHIKKLLNAHLLKESEDDDVATFTSSFACHHRWYSIQSAINTPHYGDCTGCSCQCERCYAESFFNASSIRWNSKQEGALLLTQSQDAKGSVK